MMETYASRFLSFAEAFLNWGKLSLISPEFFSKCIYIQQSHKSKNENIHSFTIFFSILGLYIGSAIYYFEKRFKNLESVVR